LAGAVHLTAIFNVYFLGIMAFIFQKPVTTKVTTASGIEHHHSFLVSAAPAWKATSEALPAVALKTVADSYLNEFLAEFLRTCSSYFAKPYSAPTILKHLTHELKAPATSTGIYSFTPVELIITAKGFRLLWNALEEQVLITLPAMEDTGELQPTEIDELQLDSSKNVLELQPPNIRHIYDKQRVKEANLRAKLAQYKANRTHLEYLEKYGQAPSDSDDSDSEADSEQDSE
jgi:hypothetical protein